jgi:hypothetical protein
MEMIMNHGFGRGQTWPFGKKRGNKIQGEEVLEDLSKSFSDGKWVELVLQEQSSVKTESIDQKSKAPKMWYRWIWYGSRVMSHNSQLREAPMLAC